MVNQRPTSRLARPWRPVASLARLAAVAVVAAILACAGNAFARGGGGCFTADTPIILAGGASKPVGEVAPGDVVLAFAPDGAITRATVREVIRHDVESYLAVTTQHATVRVTGEHPFYVGGGEFKAVEDLRPGDGVFAYDGRGLQRQEIVDIATICRPVTVYNLRTDAPNTYFAAGIAVHNKGGGGCFPAGTAVLTPRGPRAIERLEQGQQVWAVDEAGEMVAAAVEQLYATTNRLVTVRTNAGELVTTAEHPLMLPDGTFAPAGELQPGCDVLIWREGNVARATVTAIVPGAAEQAVYNLRVSPPHTFIADGFIVHNKGGGGGSRGGRSHGSSHRSTSGRGGSGGGSGLVAFFIVIGIIVAIVVIQALAARKPNLDYCYSRPAIDHKAAKTRKLLEFLAGVDPMVSQQSLAETARATFLKLQECWEARQYDPMKPLMMDDLYADHCKQIAGMIETHEINRIANLSVEQIDIVNVRYTDAADDREFTALITASAQDFYVDDRTGRRLRGDESAARFQEFWTFQLQKGKWMLRQIEQSRESDALKDENFFETVTDRTLSQIYGDQAGKEGPAGPWLDKSTQTKAEKIERMLNFLVRIDPLWNRTDMLERARRTCLNILLARQSGDENAVPAAELFADVAESLRQRIRQDREQGVAVEYRNLCVRKVELLLVRNFSDNTKDEFVVRINAHAQVIQRTGGSTIREDPDVRPFDELLTFGRLDKQWKLKEVLQPRHAGDLVGRENLDEDSSPAQLQWYYRQTRAV